MGGVIGFDYPAILQMAQIQKMDSELVAEWLQLADAALREAVDNERTIEGE